MTDDEALSNSLILEKYLSVREVKYRRNFNRYYSNGLRRDDIFNLYQQPLAFYYNTLDEDQGVIPVINAIKSAVDTVCSKLAQTRVRPFFNPINGSFKTRKVCREAQVFFDELFDKQKVYKNMVQCLRDSLIFEVGHMWIDEETRTIKHVCPWDVFYDPAEFHYQSIQSCKLRFRQYPVSALISSGKVKKGSDLYEQWVKNPIVTVAYNVHYDLAGGFRRDIVNGKVLAKKKISFKTMPIMFLYFNPPVKGSFTTSLADDIFTLQTQIDTIAFRIHSAVELTPAMSIFVPKGSNIKPSMVSNEIGSIYEASPTPSGTLPITIATPKPIDPMYKDLLDYFIEKAFNITGISQLSAQSKKPAGIESGKGLETLDDIESERHQVILENVIGAFMDLARICIDVFPADEPILPGKLGRAKVAWKEIKEQADTFNIQFSASSSLSKDPKTKMEQIEKLLGLGFINPSIAAELLQMPDLEGAYSITTASYDYSQRIIERAVEDGDFDFYPIVDLKQLYGEVQNAILRFDAADEKPGTMDRLVQLLSVVKKKIDEVTAASVPPSAPGSPTPGGAPAPKGPLTPGQAVPIGALPPVGPNITNPIPTPAGGIAPGGAVLNQAAIGGQNV